MGAEGKRKPYHLRSLIIKGRSNRWKAGTRRNKREKSVPPFESDRAKETK